MERPGKGWPVGRGSPAKGTVRPRACRPLREGAPRPCPSAQRALRAEAKQATPGLWRGKALLPAWNRRWTRGGAPSSPGSQNAPPFPRQEHANWASMLPSEAGPAAPSPTPSHARKQRREGGGERNEAAWEDRGMASARRAEQSLGGNRCAGSAHTSSRGNLATVGGIAGHGAWDAILRAFGARWAEGRHEAWPHEGLSGWKAGRGSSTPPSSVCLQPPKAAVALRSGPSALGRHVGRGGVGGSA